MSEPQTYPGERASAQEMLALADEFRNAATEARKLGRKCVPISRAPFRLLALHAIELYLTAYLLSRDVSYKDIRQLNHNLSERATRAVEFGLPLRKKTLDHLSAVTSAREYLVSRYGPELSISLSQLNRLERSLEELAGKVGAAVR